MEKSYYPIAPINLSLILVFQTHAANSYKKNQEIIKYTLFDGLAYNTCGYFASIAKNTSNEQNVRSYYMLNHRIRRLLFHYKKKGYFAIGFYFFGKSIQKHPDSVK